MLTNILLITLLIVFYIGIIYLKKIIEESNYKSYHEHNELRKIIEEIYPLVTIKTEVVNDNLKQILDISGKVHDTLLPRIEAQEKLIAELKEHQAPEEVVETVSLINEWLTGKEEG